MIFSSNCGRRELNRYVQIPELPAATERVVFAADVVEVAAGGGVSTGSGFTTTVQAADCPLDKRVAVITASPAATAVTMPRELTVATSVSEDS